MNDIEDKEKEAIAYAQVALHTLQNSANRYNITPIALGLEMQTIFTLHNSEQALIRAAEILENFGNYSVVNEYEKLSFTIEQAAQVVGLGRNSMLKLVHKEGFPSMKVGGRILVSRSKLKKWFEDNCK